MSEPWDVIVVGAGPAGLAAACEAARAGLRCLCLDKLGPGGALINLGALHGMDGDVDGPSLVARLTEEASEAGVELGFDEVARISGDGPYEASTTVGETHRARAVVLAAGMNKGVLGVEDEEAFEGRGLSHCAACDGPLYAGKRVVVAGAGGWADQEARELAAVAGHVCVVDEAAPSSDAPAAANLDRLRGRIVGLAGADGLQSISVRTADGERTLPTDAVFVYVGETPATACAPASLVRDPTGRLVVDGDGRADRLLFAAGDVRAGAARTAAEAIADGRRAARALAAALTKSGA